MKKIAILTLTFVVLFAISCKKESTNTDTIPPVITITAPAEDDTILQVYTTDSATLSFRITDEDLHAFSVLITNSAGNDTLLEMPEEHQEINDLSISQKFQLPVVVGTVKFKVIINAEDHSGNVREAIRNFSIRHTS